MVPILIYAGIAIGVAVYSYYQYRKLDEIKGTEDATRHAQTNIKTVSCEEGAVLPILYGIEEVGGIMSFAGYTREVNSTQAGLIAADVPGDFPLYEISREVFGYVQILPCYGALRAFTVGLNTYIASLYLNNVQWMNIEPGPPLVWNANFWDISAVGGGAVEYGFEIGDASNSGSVIDTIPGTATYIKRPGIAQYWLTVPLDGSSLAFPEFTAKLCRDLSHCAPIPHAIDNGANPAAVIYDLLTNAFFGNIDAAQINAASFQTAGTAFENYGSYGLALSFAINRPTKILEIIERIEEIASCVLRIDEDGKYELKVLQASDDALYTVIDEDLIEHQFNREGWETIPNSYKVLYRARSTAEDARFTDHEMIIKNEASILVGEYENTKTLDLTWIDKKLQVSHRVQEIMKRESMPRLIGDITVDRRYILADRGDVLRLTITEYAIDEYFRIVAKDTGKIDDNKITFKVVQMIEKVNDSQASDGSDPEGEPVEESFGDYEVVTFPAFNGTSLARTVPFAVDANARCRWSAGQEQSGTLINGTDFTVADSDKIVLDPVIFADDIQANALGLMSLDTWEES